MNQIIYMLAMLASLYFLIIHQIIKVGSPFKNFGGALAKLLQDLAIIAAVVVVVYIASIVLGELGRYSWGCILVPVLVFIWLITRGVSFLLWILTSMRAIPVLLFIAVIIFVVYYGMQWLGGIILGASSIIAAIVFALIQIYGCYYAGIFLHGFIKSLGGK